MGFPRCLSNLPRRSRDSPCSRPPITSPLHLAAVSPCGWSPVDITCFEDNSLFSFLVSPPEIKMGETSSQCHFLFSMLKRNRTSGKYRWKTGRKHKAATCLQMLSRYRRRKQGQTQVPQTKRGRSARNEVGLVRWGGRNGKKPQSLKGWSTTSLTG